jgi:hypothetical protein
VTCNCLTAVGRVPLEWYRNEDHIGYDLDANKIMTKKKEDRLEALLARNDSGKALRTIYDEYNDEDIVLTRQELELVQRIREGKFPHVEVSLCPICLIYTMLLTFNVLYSPCGGYVAMEVYHMVSMPAPGQPL